MPYFLDANSRNAWQALAPELFRRAGTSGKTRLSEDLCLSIDKPEEAQHVVCPAGSEVYFPNHKSHQSDGKKDVRLVEYCIIYCEGHHLTLKVVHAGVDAKCTMLSRVPVLA